MMNTTAQPQEWREVCHSPNIASKISVKITLTWPVFFPQSIFDLQETCDFVVMRDYIRPHRVVCV